MREPTAGRRSRCREACPPGGPPVRYRVWIASYGQWMPQDYADVPPDAVARELAEPDAMSAAQAARYVAAFNRTALARRRRLWAVALPVTLEFRGDARPGDLVGGRGPSKSSGLRG